MTAQFQGNNAPAVVLFGGPGRLGFLHQAHNRGKRTYLRFIPPTVAHLRGNFDRNPPMRALAGRLLPILSALAEKAAAENSP